VSTNDQNDSLQFNAPKLFVHLRDNLERDATAVVQEWSFSFVADSMVPEKAIGRLIELTAKVIETDEDTFRVEVHADGEPGDPDANVTVLLIFTGVMRQRQLKALHKRYQRAADKLGIDYQGVECFAADIRFDADELFLHLRETVGLDPNEPHDWTFGFAADFMLPEESIQSLMGLIVRAVDGVEDSLQAGVESADDETASRVMLSFTGILQPNRLKQLHKRFQKAADSLDVDYLGVELQAQAGDPANLSMEDALEWIDGVLDETADWNESELENAAAGMRERHLELLRDIGLIAADWMPTAAERITPTLRPRAEIVRRLMAAYATTAWVCAPADSVPNDQIKNYIARNGLKRNSFSTREAEWIQTPRSQVAEFVHQAGWITENLWGLAWLLGYPLTPNPCAEQASEEILGPLREFLGRFDCSFDELMTKTQLRPIARIIALEDFLYCAHNAYQNTGDVSAIGVVQERRQPLTWALSPGVAWDDTDVST